MTPGGAKKNFGQKNFVPYLDLPFLVFLRKRQGNSPIKQGFYSGRTSEILGKEGKRFEKARSSLEREKKQGNLQKQGNEDQGSLGPT